MILDYLRDALISEPSFVQRGCFQRVIMLASYFLDAMDVNYLLSVC